MATTFAVVRTWSIMIMINSDRFPVFIIIILHGRADRFLVLVSNGQATALSDWAYYHVIAPLFCNKEVNGSSSSMSVVHMRRI